MRDAVDRAQQAEKSAVNTGAEYGQQASQDNSQLFPYLTRQLNNPTGFSQPQETAMLGAAEGGAGGATAGLTTEANLKSARDRNSGGFSGALDDAARQKDKALAGVSEGIAGQNANLEQEKQMGAAQGLGSLEGMDQSAQLKAMGLEPEDINAEVGANKTGWFQNTTDLLNSIKGAGYSAGAGGKAYTA